MPVKFPSEEWTAAYRQAVNDNPNYRTAGREWTHGAVALVVKAEPAAGLESDMAMLLDVHAGECRSARYLPANDARGLAAFVVESSYARWKDVIEGRLDPIKAMLLGRLALTKGSLPTMIRYVASSRELVRSAGMVPTDFAA